MKKGIYIVSTVILGTLLLTGCMSNNDSGQSTQQPVNQNQDANDHNQVNQNNNNNKTNQSDENVNTNEQTNNTTKDHSTSDLTSKLKMDKAQIKQPTSFPGHKSFAAAISKNTTETYTIDYQTKGGQKLATFTGTKYQSAKAAANKLADFMGGKAVPENKETGKDLGHGIKGYAEGAAGHAYFSWQEGNWTLSLSSLTKDEMDQPAIAHQMVNFLEKHYLPAPHDKGIVYVDYSNGGDSVQVDIRWQDNEMIYQLQTNQVPVDALNTMTTVK